MSPLARMDWSGRMVRSGELEVALTGFAGDHGVVRGRVVASHERKAFSAASRGLAPGAEVPVLKRMRPGE